MIYYNLIAKSYDKLHKEEQEVKLKLIKTLIKPKPTQTLLDVGCGTGISSDWNCKVTGIDPSEELIKIAGEKYNHTFIIGTAESLPFKDNYFDFVICISAIHLTSFTNSLDEIKRVGKNNFIITILKKSSKFNGIMKEIKNRFIIKKQLDNQQDLILYLNKRT